MDQELKAFRAAAVRENEGRAGLQRRYSPPLRAKAVRYWETRRRAGDAQRDVAEALGVASWSLSRWTRAAQTRGRFHPVEVVPAAIPTDDARVVIVVSGASTRVEGLDVERAARLLVLLR